MTTLLNTKTMHPRDQITLVMKRIYDRVLTTTSGGNLSIRDDEDNIWITPSGVDKGLLKPADIICVKKNGEIVGVHPPSSEYPFHLAIYKQRPDINAVIHAHPPGLVAFSIVRKVPYTSVLPQVRAFCGEIGYAAYAMPGTHELGEKIAREFEKGLDVVIMENHGTVVGASDISEAYQKFELIETTAKSILYGNQLGTLKYLTEEQIDEHFKHFQNNLPAHENSFSFSSDVKEKRTDIFKIVKRACRQGLMQGAFGSISTRCNDNDFLITPEKISKWDISLDDIVYIKNGKVEIGKRPDKSVLIHQAIYQEHKDINAIIITQPIYLTSFAITGATFNVRTIPETWIYLQDVKTKKFGSHFFQEDDLISNITPDSPVLILENEGVIVTGNKLLQAFDYLEVAEFSAKSVILSSSLGEMIPIDNLEIDELGKVMNRWKNYEWKM
ncbi:class II aldolase/adducin family protein [Niabella aquatica]